MLVNLTATFSSIFVELEWKINRLAVLVKFSSGVTVPIVFHYYG